MRGIAIIQNGITTYAPYNRSTIAFYEERNMLIRGTRNEEKEYSTVREATPDEVVAHLLPEQVVTSPAPTPALNVSTVSDMEALKSLFIQQQAELAALRSQLSTQNSTTTANVQAPVKATKSTKVAVVDTPEVSKADQESSSDDLQDKLLADFQDIV